MALLKKYLWLSQISLFSLLLICSLIIPSVTKKNGGVSNFGDHASTVGFYVLAFALCILFLCLAATRLLEMDPHFRPMAYVLLCLAALIFLVLMTTFLRHLGATYYEAHDYLGVVLYTYEFGLSVWWVIRQQHFRMVLLFSIQSGGSMIGLLSILNVIHLLYFGQVIGAVGFGLLLVTAFPELIQAGLSA